MSGKSGIEAGPASGSNAAQADPSPVVPAKTIQPGMRELDASAAAGCGLGLKYEEQRMLADFEAERANASATAK